MQHVYTLVCIEWATHFPSFSEDPVWTPSIVLQAEVSFCITISTTEPWTKLAGSSWGCAQQLKMFKYFLKHNLFKVEIPLLWLVVCIKVKKVGCGGQCCSAYELEAEVVTVLNWCRFKSSEALRQWESTRVARFEQVLRVNHNQEF